MKNPLKRGGGRLFEGAFNRSITVYFHLHSIYNGHYNDIWKQIWATLPFENSSFFLVLLNFEFPVADGCSKKSILWINFIQTFECSFGSMDQSICSNLCFGHFWDIGDALLFFFTWVNFSVSFSTINNSDCDTPLVALAKTAS